MASWGIVCRQYETKVKKKPLRSNRKSKGVTDLNINNKREGNWKSRWPWPPYNVILSIEKHLYSFNIFQLPDLSDYSY
jgi:hypothetical protein